jgi:hypothetical protein
MDNKEWAKAREAWVKCLALKATKTQKAEIAELDSLKTFSQCEIIFKVFGWRSPISEEIWKSRTNRKEKMGLNESVYYLLRVVLDIPLHPAPKNLTLTDLTKTKLKELILVGIENGHVETSGKDPDQSVRAAINEVLKRLKIKSKKAGELDD